MFPVRRLRPALFLESSDVVNGRFPTVPVNTVYQFDITSGNAVRQCDNTHMYTS